MVFLNKGSPSELDEMGQARAHGAKDHKNKAWQDQQLTAQQRAATGDNPEGIATSEAPHFGRDHIVTADPKPSTFLSTPTGMVGMAAAAAAVLTVAAKALRK
ncbi:unnamed protein product [Bursaphelenchus xylophilus]|uniref:(pine wood nematode) hypothetical protein n=1 Tax=Bursaphelenchus xylophilus TaxID=6326 RepID=A0A1I7RPB1_BURXY|nr:unnamed protein product [Bursaphelenchus xylophilus]CAG9095717.1 unnamed protein product [Bursaphelenchus xylophilus]